MSARNTLASKSYRQYCRVNRPRPERRAISTIDLESSAGVLTEKHKHGASLGARGRRYLMRSRADLLVMPVTPAKDPGAKLAAKLSKLTLGQLVRRRIQFATRAAGARYKLEALSPDSRFRPALQRLQDINLAALKLTNSEIEVRTAVYRQPDGN